MTALPANIIEAMTSPDWWGPWFRRGDWSRWHAFLKAAFGLPMTEAEAAVFRECTGRTDPPEGRARETWAICGRRGRKTRIMATTAAWLAAFEDWSEYLDPGEVATIPIVAKDRAQARTALRYLRSLLSDHPVLSKLVLGESEETIELSNGVNIEVGTASFRSLRSYTIPALIADELAFWYSGDTSANPAEEILAAVKPAMLTMPNGLLMVASSPHARRGPLWETFRRYHGQPGPVLVWKAPTLTMNPAAPRDEIEAAYAADPAKAAAEYGAEFRSDVETFIAREVVEAAVAPGRFELPPAAGIAYFAFTDPSGGSSDSMTLAIAHRDRDGCAVVDAVRERRPPFSPEAVVAEFAVLLKRYRVHAVSGDRYGGEWPREQFQKQGISYNVATRRRARSTWRRCRYSTAARPSCRTIPSSLRRSAPWSGVPPAAARIRSTTRPAPTTT